MSDYWKSKTNEELINSILNDPFKEAYIDAMFFTDSGEDDDSIPKGASLTDFTHDALVRIVTDCWDFQNKLEEALEDANEAGADCYDDAISYDEKAAGHDFWLTRNGHGCGFWDGDWDEPFASIADKIAKGFGEIYPYSGDTGLIDFF